MSTQHCFFDISDFFSQCSSSFFQISFLLQGENKQSQYKYLWELSLYILKLALADYEK